MGKYVDWKTFLFCVFANIEYALSSAVPWISLLSIELSTIKIFYAVYGFINGGNSIANSVFESEVTWSVLVEAKQNEDFLLFFFRGDNGIVCQSHVSGWSWIIHRIFKHSRNGKWLSSWFGFDFEFRFDCYSTELAVIFETLFLQRVAIGTVCINDQLEASTIFDISKIPLCGWHRFDSTRIHSKLPIKLNIPSGLQWDRLKLR